MKKLIVPALLSLLTACSSVTIKNQNADVISSDPTWSDSKSFFFWGLAGTGDVDVDQVCGGRTPVQLQTQRTFVDGLLGLITFGIYSPRTANVWCQQ